jgi:hypothetical protein
VIAKMKAKKIQIIKVNTIKEGKEIKKVGMILKIKREKIGVEVEIVINKRGKKIKEGRKVIMIMTH